MVKFFNNLGKLLMPMLASIERHLLLWRDDRYASKPPPFETPIVEPPPFETPIDEPPQY